MKKLGFTLIELLAVIIIITIIFLISTPMLLDIVDNVKKEALIQNSKNPL
jgi:prepilin-type N-terminal cleavage/methylation domain-containing protein